MECFLVEMWEDLRVKVGERDTFQSSGCFREGPSNSSIKKLEILNEGVK